MSALTPMQLQNADCCAEQWQSACRKPDRDPRHAGRTLPCWRMYDPITFPLRESRQYQLPTRCIRLHLDGDPADYTTDARTDNVVRIGSKNIR